MHRRGYAKTLLVVRAAVVFVRYPARTKLLPSAGILLHSSSSSKAVTSASGIGKMADSSAEGSTPVVSAAAIAEMTAEPASVAAEGVDGATNPLGPDGKPLSKNQLKKLAKGKPIAPKAEIEASSKKEEKKAGKDEAAAEAAAPSAAKAKKQVEAFHYTNTTPAGEKKDTSGEMLPAYHPQAVEAAWNSWWEAAGYYNCEPSKAEAAGEAGRFVMVIPPPNVTGSLHLGHALTSAVEDALTRWHRMCGRPTMWLPGTDHAGIATQTVVEKRLQKERGVSRHDLGREAFVQEVWKWKETYGNRITSQLRHLGVSTDWSREAFTMDSNLSKAVNEAFVRLHEDGLIYRDNRLVNWCCSLRSAISDIEVDYIDLEKRTRLSVPGHDPVKKYEFGCITSFAYKVAATGPDGKPVAEPADGGAPGTLPGAEEGKPGAPNPAAQEIIVATTRIETMLGDTAVAVHPADPRYTHLHGKYLVHPLDTYPANHSGPVGSAGQPRLIPIITDGELVDMAFGTGAVKVTPAHDPNDFVCGKKHGLEFITVFTEEGRMADRAPAAFKGTMRFDCREAISKALEAKGLFRGKADNKMRLGLCSRTGDVIEPLIKPQWYVKCDTMAKAAADAVRNGELAIEPEMHKSIWFGWLDNIKDWCISRQLWWGHRIPAYLVAIAGQAAPESSNPDNWVVARTEAQAKAMAAQKWGVPESSVSLSQDEDVLDTWFSSGLFPFSTFGWPNTEHPDYKAFYPNTLLETGHDILFFWVARMVMMGLQLTGKLPFRTVYLHAMVRDKYGRKMSKSLGNVVDPMEVIYGCDLDTLHQKIRDGNLPAKEVETAIKGQKLDYPEGIPECGADALRFGLLAYTVQGRDINLDINRVVAYRQFCNKLWNATRFTLAHLSSDRYTPVPLLDAVDELSSPHTPLAVRDRWILSRLNAAVQGANKAMTEYSFGDATKAIYDFFLYEFCDYYLELTKPLFSGDASAAVEAGGDVAKAQRLARMTLQLCLDVGLRLLHPMMPFVTEELWQRLPGRGEPQRASGSPADPPSIMIAPYPQPVAALARPDVEADFFAYQALVRCGRGLRADADIIPSKSAGFYIVCGPAGADNAARRVAESQVADLTTLLRASFIKIVSAQSEVEEGCSVRVVNDKCSIHLLLKGLIDPLAEIAKLEKKAEKLQKDADTLKRRAAAPGYADKVPADVREKDAEAVAVAEAQIDTLRSLQDQYRSWHAQAQANAAQ